MLGFFRCDIFSFWIGQTQQSSFQKEQIKGYCSSNMMGLITKGFFFQFCQRALALSNGIIHQTVSSEGDWCALIIFPYFISSLEPTLTVFLRLLLSVKQNYGLAGMLIFQEKKKTSLMSLS